MKIFLKFAAVFLALAGAGMLWAADAPAPAATNNSLSITSPGKRASWQQHLTLGAGDALNFALYLKDTPEEARENVIIGPDGRVSYLQAVDVPAAGLTIDELREKIDAELGKYYRAPRTIITPAAIHSKKYYVLGSVVNKGVYTFDRPLTVIEAIARAGGLETGVFERNTVELADLSRSFLIRKTSATNSERIPVDFEKLFQQGDLSQNVPLAPDDYLYFASAGANEIYVLGEVLAPGIVPFSRNTTVITAITARGGFTLKAYKGRALIVRGSLKSPKTFVVDLADVLKAKQKDFALQPKDIVFIAPRPWEKAEQLLDDSTKAFITAVIVAYTGAYVGPFMSPILK